MNGSPVSLGTRRKKGGAVKRAGFVFLLLIFLLVVTDGVMYYAFFPKREGVFPGLATPLNIAHQGGELIAPSNTMAAFDAAASLQVDVMELDIHLSKDGHLVVIHDNTVDRTTNGKGRVDALTLSELQSFDAAYAFQELNGEFSFRDKEVRIPTLNEVFDKYANSYHFIIEIKESYPKQGESQIERKLWELITQYGLEDKVIVASFYDDVIERFAKLSEGKVALGAGGDEVTKFVLLHKLFLDGFYRPKADVLQIPVQSHGINLKDRRLIEAAHRLNMQVHYWTIDDPQEMRELLGLGADGIITNRPDLLKEVLSETAK